MANDHAPNSPLNGASMDKASLRKALRTRRSALDATEQQAAATSLADHICQHRVWTKANNVALYMAADGEIDPRPLADRARKDGKQLFLPVIQGPGVLHFKQWQDGAVLTDNCFGIPEPDSSAREVSATELDVICLPLVGWDTRGGRLGMGGGYYDRSLQTLKRDDGPLLIGLAHACQQLEQVPLQPWDIRLDMVATDLALHLCTDD